MAQLHRSVVALRVMGDDLIPSEVTALIDVKPSVTATKGNRVVVDAQVLEILGRLTGDLEIWRELGRRFRIDVFCGAFMRKENEGFSLAPQVLLALGQRGVMLDCNLYAP